MKNLYHGYMARKSREKRHIYRLWAIWRLDSAGTPLDDCHLYVDATVAVEEGSDATRAELREQVAYTIAYSLGNLTRCASRHKAC